MWLQIDIVRAGALVRVNARGSRGEQTGSRPFGPDVDVEAITRFGAEVRNAAARGRALDRRSSAATSSGRPPSAAIGAPRRCRVHAQL